MRRLAIVCALASVACGPAFSTAAETDDAGHPSNLDVPPSLLPPLVALDAGQRVGALMGDAGQTPSTLDAGDALMADSGPLMAMPDVQAQAEDAGQPSETSTGYPGVTCAIVYSAGNSACQNRGDTPAWTCSRDNVLDTGVTLPDPTSGAPRPSDLPEACWINYVNVQAGSGGTPQYVYCC